MVQVQVPEGVVEGGMCAFVMPSGTTVQIVVPPGSGPGTILEVADPGAMVPTAAVVGIEATGPYSPISGMHALGPQHMPAGFDMLGDKYGIVAKTLAPGETFHSEPGAMVFMTEEVTMGTRFGGFGKTASRVVSGESFAKVEYTNSSQAPGVLGMTPNQPFSMVIPVQMGALPGNSLNVKRGAYMSGTPDVTAELKTLPARDCAACCCGGMPPLIQEVRGAPTGTAFLAAAGTIVAKSLQAGEAVVVDSDVIVGFENSVTFEVKKVGDCKTCCLGGEGCYNTVLTGPGTVYLQSISIDKLMAQLITIQQEAENDGGGGDDFGGDDGGPVGAQTIDR